MNKVAVAAVVLFGVAGQSAHAAGLTLTSFGITEGLALSTFASGYPSTSASFGVGPISYAIDPTSGRVVTTSYASGHVISYANNTDGQTYSGGTASTQVYGAPAGLAVLNGQLYIADQGSGISGINGFGNVVNGIFFAAPSATGLAASSATGLLYVSDSAGLQSINPSNGQVSTIFGGTFDGLTTTTDGTELFAERAPGDGTNHVYGYRTSDFTQVFDSGAIATADGALIANLAGTPVLFVNTNNGDLYQVDLTTAAQTLIATGGSRGDLVSLDTTNNTAILSQSDSLLRLSLPAGSTFGSTDVPEPTSMALIAAGLIGLARLRRRA